MSTLSPESRRTQLPAVFSADSISLHKKELLMDAIFRILDMMELKMEAKVIRTSAMLLRRDRP